MRRGLWLGIVALHVSAAAGDRGRRRTGLPIGRRGAGDSVLGDRSLAARGPPTDWGEFVQADDDRAILQASPDELPVINIHMTGLGFLYQAK